MKLKQKFTPSESRYIHKKLWLASPRKGTPNQRRSLQPVVNIPADLRGCQYQWQKNIKRMEQTTQDINKLLMISERSLHQQEQKKEPHDYQIPSYHIVFSIRMNVTDDSIASPTATNYPTACHMIFPEFFDRSMTALLRK
jgi:hypothetical protein